MPFLYLFFIYLIFYVNSQTIELKFMSPDELLLTTSNVNVSPEFTKTVFVKSLNHPVVVVNETPTELAVPLIIIFIVFVVPVVVFELIYPYNFCNVPDDVNLISCFALVCA